MGYIKQALAFILFSFIIQTTSAQDKKYDTVWTKVQRLVNQNGLTATALKEVNKIYALAKKENNDAQLIKALIYQAMLQESSVENAQIKAITDLEAEIKSVKEPAASILHSIVAERYLEYFQQNRWKFYDRTSTTIVKDNIEGWSIDQFHKKITEHYLASVKNETLLQQTLLQKYEPIIIKGNARALRPTLFDLLAHRALAYFRNEERDITRPAYAFYINEPVALADAEAFMRHRFITSDSLSLQHKAIQLYQRILAFHQQDKVPDAFIDADISRLEFVKQYGQFDNKDSLYLSALQNITSKYPDYKTGGPAYYLIAQWHANMAATYLPATDTSHRFDFVKAKVIVEKLLQTNRENEVATNSNTLLNSIHRQQLEMATEKVTIPGKPFLSLVNYRNVATLNLRIVQLSDAMKRELADRYDDKYWQQLTNLPVMRRWSQSLPATNDYQQHRVEIKIDELPVGNYLMLASADENFGAKDKVTASHFFYVSNISYINNRNDYFVLDRETGKPLPNASIQLWNYRYDYDTRKNVLSVGEKLKADNNGFFRVREIQHGSREVRFEFAYKNDRLFDDEYQDGIFTARTGNDLVKATAESFEKENRQIFFFADRSIYRPGQKLYFKGILITKDFVTRKSKVITALQTTIHLHNANYEIIDSMKVTTNEFGSFSGSFQLPENLLNGSFRLRAEQLNSELYFSVEEYKRPKFYVEYEVLKGTYTLGDSVLVTGFAKAYAGNNISL